MRRNRSKLKKAYCEIEGCPITDPAMLHKHHIIERTEIGTSNDDFNLVILCSNHHNLLHNTKRLRIIGVYPSTKPPNGRTVIYELDGKCNMEGITEPYCNYKPKQMKLVQNEICTKNEYEKEDGHYIKPNSGEKD